MKLFFIICSLLIATQALSVIDPPYGPLKITGTHLTKLDGTPVQLRGMSLYWSNLPNGYDFFNNETIYQLKCFWNSNVVRAPLAVSIGWGDGGYMNDSAAEYPRIVAVIEAAIANGIYVLVDWHEEHAYYANHTTAAIQFFTNISATYGQYPHVIYETFNEPSNATWETIRAYHVQVIAAIRANDPDNVIVAGTPEWSSDVVAAAKNPINATNIAYTYHFYAGSIDQYGIEQVTQAIGMGLPIFVTEYGTTLYSGTGPVNANSTGDWWNFLDQNKISYVNWAIARIDATSIAIFPNTTVNQVGLKTQWTESGAFVNQMLWSKDQGLVCSSGK